MKNKFTVIGIILTTVILAGVAIFTAMRLYETRDEAVAPNAPSSKPAASGELCGGITGATCATGEECIYSNGTTRAPSADASGICTPVNSGRQATNACSLSFTLSTPTPTATSTATATATATATSTATANPQCNTTCSTSSECPSGLTCYKPNGATAGNCRNTQCTTESDCLCNSTPTATATATATSTATANPQCNYACTSNSNCPSDMICYIATGATSGNCRNTQCLGEADCVCNVATATPTTTPTLPVVGTSWPTILGTGFGILVILGSLLLAL